MSKPLALTLAAGLLTGCGAAEEAPRVQRALVVDAAGLAPTTTDLGWVVTVTAARAVVQDVTLTRGGEPHAAGLPAPLRWLVGVAYAHPGHGAGGEAVASLAGRQVLDLAADGALIGTLTALTGPVDGLDFRLVNGQADDGLAADDPLLGCGVYLAGEATKGEQAVPFTACLDFGDGAVITGAPLDHTIADAPSGPAVGLSLALQDPFEPDTVFDGVDFAATTGPLTLRGDAASAAGPLVRKARTHDHWRGTVRPE